MIFRRHFTSGFVIAAGLLAVPAGADSARSSGDPQETDPRVERIRRFFEQRNCPAQHHAADFVEAADRHQLDWRLLPSLSLVESTGGKYACRNNVFGWNSCRTGFPSVVEGIHTVARGLADGARYRGKSVEGILRTYNPRRAYAARVLAVMRQFGAPALEPTASR